MLEADFVEVTELKADIEELRSELPVILVELLVKLVWYDEAGVELDDTPSDCVDEILVIWLLVADEVGGNVLDSPKAVLEEVEVGERLKDPDA